MQPLMGQTAVAESRLGPRWQGRLAGPFAGLGRQAVLLAELDEARLHVAGGIAELAGEEEEEVGRIGPVEVAENLQGKCRIVIRAGGQVDQVVPLLEEAGVVAAEVFEQVAHGISPTSRSSRRVKSAAGGGTAGARVWAPVPLGGPVS